MLTLTVKPDDGEPYELTAGSRDVLKWERTTKGASLKKFQEGLDIATMYRISYIAATRQNLFVGTLAEFEDTCELEFPEDDEDEDDDSLDPTQLEASTTT